MNVAIVGLGLIGGSLGMALRRAGVRVVGRDARPEVVARALERGAIDAEGDVASAEVVIVAVPVDAIAGAVDALVPELRPDAVVTDTGSVKAPIVRAIAAAHPWLRFVGGHPMFGTAAAGIEAADGALVPGHTFIVTPAQGADGEAVKAVTSLAGAVGMVPLQMDADEHDRLVAQVSHLPYAIACALALSADRTDVAGPAFRDMTRVAASPPALWREILRMNQGPFRAAVRQFAAELERLASLEGGALEAELEKARQRRMG